MSTPFKFVYQSSSGDIFYVYETDDSLCCLVFDTWVTGETEIEIAHEVEKYILELMMLANQGR